MLSIILLFVGLVAADHEQNNFVAVEWGTQTDGTVFLVPPAITAEAAKSDTDRMPAGQGLPPSYEPPYVAPTPPKRYLPRPKPAPYKGKYAGLGRLSCIKKGYLDAGEGDVSNKFLAMIAVRSKDRASSGGLTNDQIERQVLRETIYTSAAIGPCTGSDYRFKGNEAARAEQWLNTPRIDVGRDEYNDVFQMDSRRVDMSVKSYEYTPGRVQRDWKYWNKGTAAAGCARALPANKRVRLCQIIARACGAVEVGCNRGYVENKEDHGGGDGGNSNGGNTSGGDTTGGSDTGGGTTGGDTGGGTTGGDTGGGTTGGDTGGGDTGSGNDGGTTGNSESGNGSNDGAGHGGDAGGGHGSGPGG